MRYPILLALSGLLLASCGQSENPLLPELQGRWAPEKGAQARLVLAATDSRMPAKPPNTQDLCQSNYATFQKFRSSSDFFGAVFLHRDGRRDAAFLVKDAKREGERFILTGQEPNHPIAGSGQTRLELILRRSEIAFDNIFDQRGRSVRYDRFQSDDPIRAQRAGITTIGDVFRMLFDLKSCTV